MADAEDVNDHWKEKKNIIRNQSIIMNNTTEHSVKILDDEILDDEILDDEILDDEILSEKDNQMKKEKQQNMFVQIDFDVFDSA